LGCFGGYGDGNGGSNKAYIRTSFDSAPVPAFHEWISFAAAMPAVSFSDLSN